MRLARYYLGDPRVVLIPIEHLTPTGMSPAFAALVGAERGWSAARIGLFDAAFARYWERAARLARATRTWPAPRRRHVAVITGATAIRPYVQLLNTSAWTLYDSDLDPERSDPEFVAYLLVHGDRMAMSGEVTTAALHTAPYWFERSDAECAAFAAAAARSPRPDAAGFVAVGDALPWLRRLRHETLRPPVTGAGARAIAGTGLVVPAALAAEPPALIERWTTAARTAVATQRAAWRGFDPDALAALCEWLTTAVPPLLVTAARGRIVWDPERPLQLGALRAELRDADPVALRSVAADLRVVDHHTRAFHAALADPATLPRPAAETEQRGYTYLHRERALIAYNLREPGIERLHGPELPFARAMLGARTIHEWAHLPADAGWVPQTVSPGRAAELRAAFAGTIAAAIAAAPAAVRAVAAADLAALAGGATIGAGLTALLLARMPDHQANLVAWRFLAEDERETYVRHNVRTLRGEYSPARLWRMLVRYLYELQYLALGAVEDRRGYFLSSTWFAEDLLATGILTDASFDALAAAVADLCASYAVDEGKFRRR